MIEPEPAVASYSILDTAPETAFDDIVNVAAAVCVRPGVPELHRATGRSLLP